MKISSTPLPTPSAASAASDNVAPAANAASSAASSAASPAASGGDLPAGALQQAKAALSALPEIDQARVSALRDALAKGELPFDAARLAGLIDRYHGGRS